jgi:CubicO group peptidase (beta-lactamase class C family)
VNVELCSPITKLDAPRPFGCKVAQQSEEFAITNAIGRSESSATSKRDTVFDQFEMLSGMRADIRHSGAGQRFAPNEGPRDMPAGRAICTLAALLLVAALGTRAAAASEPGLDPPEGVRQFLTVQDFTAETNKAPEALHYGHFMPVGEAGPAHHDLSGRLTFPAFPVAEAGGRGLRNAGGATLPGFTAEVFSRDGRLIPAEQGIIRINEVGPWDIILSPGKVWSEPDDGAWSRASFPFTLVDQRWGGSRNSEMRLQVAQEAAPNAPFDLWAQIPITYEVEEVADKDRLWHDLMARRAARVPVRPWADLEATHGDAVLGGFDGVGNRINITVSGLLLDDTFFLRPCRTRLGPYPYCEEMRHAVYSHSKTIGALIAMLRLAEKYGPAVWDERILDHVPLPVSHDGWNGVTFRHALNMTTGIGDIVPRKVSGYVETDFSPLSLRVGNAPTIKDKLALMAGFENYPWAPGEVFRYRTVDTFILTLAMDRYLKSREGPDARLWDMMVAEVFQPLDIGPLPVVETREPQAERRIPLLGSGMLPTFNQVLRLAQLLQRGGAWQGEQILHAGLTAEAVDHTRKLGLPTGWRYKEGGEARYHLAFWRTPHRAKAGCTVYLPVMGGYGGNYLLLMPGDTIALRFADGDDNAAATWNSYAMREAADTVKPFC